MKLLLKQALFWKKMRAKDLAAALGISPVSISYMVNGKSMPSLETAKRISDVLGLPMDLWVVDDDYVIPPMNELFSGYMESTGEEFIDDDLVDTLPPSMPLLVCPHCGKAVQFALVPADN